MSYIEDHHRRWGQLFGHEPWFEMQCALYEGPGHDWEGADLAMEQVLYALAKARGVDTTQTCPRCRNVVDQVRSLPDPASASGVGCDACEAQWEWEHLADALVKAERRWAYQRWYAALTPEQRAIHDREAAQQAQFYLGGLITRDVQ